MNILSGHVKCYILQQEGLSPLMIASNTGHVDAVKLLVKYMHRPKLNMQNKVLFNIDRKCYVDELCQYRRDSLL